jgi:hypothetical protein
VNNLKPEIQYLKIQPNRFFTILLLSKASAKTFSNVASRAKKDGYFTKENLLKQLDHFQPHFTTSPTNNQQVRFFTVKPLT